MFIDRRLGGVLLAGAAVTVLCAWRLAANRPQTYTDQLQAARIERPASDFEGLDAYNQMFRLRRYLGRHRVLVVFYSAEKTAAGDPGLVAIREAYPELRSRDIQVVGVSTALPQENRAALKDQEEMLFPLVSDVDLSIHDKWGRLDRQTGRPLPGVFLVDRKGAVVCYGVMPQPAEDVAALIEELLRS